MRRSLIHRWCLLEWAGVGSATSVVAVGDGVAVEASEGIAVALSEGTPDGAASIGGDPKRNERMSCSRSRRQLSHF